jgi:predicted DsbA family dithiol-disulfide isomerase
VRIDRLREEFELEVRWRTFPLHPDTPQEGQELAELFGGGGFDIDAILQRCRTIAAGLGLDFGPRSRTFNSRRAQELGKWAEAQGAGEAFHAAVYRAYFVDGRNIARPDELLRIAVGVGLDQAAAQQAIDTRFGKDPVDRDWQEAARIGVTAVPTVLCGGQALVGFQDYASYRRLIADAG